MSVTRICFTDGRNIVSFPSNIWLHDPRTWGLEFVNRSFDTRKFFCSIYTSFFPHLTCLLFCFNHLSSFRLSVISFLFTRLKYQQLPEVLEYSLSLPRFVWVSRGRMLSRPYRVSSGHRTSLSVSIQRLDQKDIPGFRFIQSETTGASETVFITLDHNTVFHRCLSIVRFFIYINIMLF